MLGEVRPGMGPMFHLIPIPRFREHQIQIQPFRLPRLQDEFKRRHRPGLPPRQGPKVNGYAAIEAVRAVIQKP